MKESVGGAAQKRHCQCVFPACLVGNRICRAPPIPAVRRGRHDIRLFAIYLGNLAALILSAALGEGVSPYLQKFQDVQYFVKSTCL